LGLSTLRGVRFRKKIKQLGKRNGPGIIDKKKEKRLKVTFRKRCPLVSVRSGGDGVQFSSGGDEDFKDALKGRMYSQEVRPRGNRLLGWVER